LQNEAKQQFIYRKSGDFNEIDEENFVHALNFRPEELAVADFCLDDVQTTVSIEIASVNQSQMIEPSFEKVAEE